MQETLNYKLKKPEVNDTVDITKLNDNMDILDTKVKEIENKASNITIPVESVNGKTGKVDLKAIDIKTTDGQTVESQLNDYTTHKKDTSIHVTQTEKSTWNGKQNNLGFTPENITNKGKPNGYASLGSDGKVPSTQLANIESGEWNKIQSISIDTAIPQIEINTLPLEYKKYKIICTLKDSSTLSNGSRNPYAQLYFNEFNQSVNNLFSCYFGANKVFGKKAYEQLSVGADYYLNYSEVIIDNSFTTNQYPVYLIKVAGIMNTSNNYGISSEIIGYREVTSPINKLIIVASADTNFTAGKIEIWGCR